MTVQCKQIVRAGHQCPYIAKRDGFCESHWRKRFGHQWDIAALTCRRCKGAYREVGETCLVSPYLDQPPSVYPEPVR
jgi:hypothetical protein